ncbi:MAG: hypothetical protein AAF485_24825 [Chloroflexota bacterium]
MLWSDIQDTFVILTSDLVVNIILPFKAAAGVLIAILTMSSRWWKPSQRIEIKSRFED